MRLTRTRRSGLALFTAVLLLWCQALYAMQACVTLTAPANAAGAAAAPAPCHHDPADPAHQDYGRAAANECEIAKAFSQEVKLPVLALADLVTEPVPSFAAAAPPAPAAAGGGTHAVCHSPPLNLLHCRLLN